MRKWQLQCKEQALQVVLETMPTSTESNKTLQLVFRGTTKQNLDTWYIFSV
jgi:cephalosporin-C deacetylase-like acetyl esterase